jgi:hypothetical protein
MCAIHSSQLHSFVLVRTIRLCMHIIKLPNRISKLAILKIIILLDFETVSKFQTVKETDFWQSAKLRTKAIFKWP